MAEAQRRSEITIDKNDEGLLFKNNDGSLHGAIKYDEETFQVTATPKTTNSGKKLWEIKGEGNVGDTITGTLFEEEGGVGSTGKDKPIATGKVETTNGKMVRRIACWNRKGPKAEFLSAKLSIPGQRG